MVCELGGFTAEYLDRVTQLTNKTNQFNLTTKRYSRADMEAIAGAPDTYVAFHGRLIDKFGDNGIISVVVGRREHTTLHLDLWLMSCRVLKRGMEEAMLDALVDRARALKVDTIVGTYLPTPKNGMVADHYGALGFECVERTDDGRSRWSLGIGSDYRPRNTRIREVSRG